MLRHFLGSFKHIKFFRAWARIITWFGKWWIGWASIYIRIKQFQITMVNRACSRVRIDCGNCRTNFNAGLFGSKLTITATNGLPVSSEVLNEFLGTIYIDNAALGIDLKVAPSYTLKVTDANTLSDTESVTSY